MLTRGTSKTSKADFAMEVESMGGRFHAKNDREQTHLDLTVMKGDMARAVALLGDAVSNATLDGAEFELCKETINAEHDAKDKDFRALTLENCHYNSYRDNMMGQPIMGDRDQLNGLRVEDLQNYRAANYFGDNMVIVATGNVDHEAFVDQVN